MSGDDKKPEPERRRLVRAPPQVETPPGAAMGTPVKTADHRTLSSQQWLRRQLNDPFVKAAKAHGYRARAAYKLTDIDDKFHLIHKGSRVVDLGCAPGGWLQVALERGAASVAGVDLLPVDPLPPTYLIEGDFTDPAIGPRLIEHLGGAPDIVLFPIWRRTPLAIDKPITCGSSFSLKPPPPSLCRPLSLAGLSSPKPSKAAKRRK